MPVSAGGAAAASEFELPQPASSMAQASVATVRAGRLILVSPLLPWLAEEVRLQRGGNQLTPRLSTELGDERVQNA